MADNKKDIFHIRIDKKMEPKLRELADLIGTYQSTTIRPRQALEIVIDQELKVYRRKIARKYMKNS